MKKIILLFLICFSINKLYAQSGRPKYEKVLINGKLRDIMIVDGDTIPIINLEGVTIAGKRSFKSKDDRLRYNNLRQNALYVYPMAKEAIKIFREVKKETETMKSRQGKNYAKKIEKELTPQYEEKLKSLTKTQGYILIKMVERELHVPFYDVIKDLRGGMEAFKWQQLGVWYGYNLKKGYRAKEDPALEAILKDLNISYED